jgi:uncharacterized protein (DUF1499 family)
MARRYFADEPTSKLAVWAWRMAVFSLAATLLAVIIVRAGLLEIRPGLATFAGALAFAVVALLLAIAAFVVIWKDGLAGMGHALGAMVLSFALLAYPSYFAVKAYRLPWIYDITTDPIDPPRYEALAKVRPRDANPVAYAGLYAAEQQRSAYPDVESLEQNASPEAAYKAALAIINKRRWRIVDERPPQLGRRDGHIEAVARTPVLGFRDDVVVRVRPDGDGSRIDVRSSSRHGTFDFGTNATRIRSLLEDIDEAIGDQPAERPTEAPLPKKTAPKKGGQPRTNR